MVLGCVSTGLNTESKIHDIVSLILETLYIHVVSWDISMTYPYEPRHEKTNILHMQKQRRRSALG